MNTITHSDGVTIDAPPMDMQEARAHIAAFLIENRAFLGIEVECNIVDNTGGNEVLLFIPDADGVKSIYALRLHPVTLEVVGDE